ncbi:MAG: FtsW/RodA/SpoVE family cell cycle protein [Bacilli bacterium]|nr:FtsW/RodA/SpoVE family cell cycle protein [Bacilli bacterium]
MLRQKISFKIIIPVILFAIISIVTIYSASTYISAGMGNLALKQAIWYLAGIVVVIFIVKMGNNYLYDKAFLFYIFGIVSLLGLLLFATPINSSKCWYIVPGLGSIQPSEFMKIFLMLYLGVFIHDFRDKYTNPSIKEELIFIIKSFVIFLIPAVLTFMQPDTGSVIIYLVIYLCMMFLSGIRARWFIIAFGIIGAILGTVLGIYFFNGDMFIKVFGTDLFYRLDRIFAWTSGSGLQLENALASIGSGGLVGHGFNHTPLYFPESGTDFIFAVFASNFGFIGCLLLVGLILYFDINLILLFKKKIQDTEKFVLAGIVGMLLFQQIQNIGMTIGLLPITGITLPFISYGGSSLLSYMILIGILINISNEKDHKYKY